MKTSAQIEQVQVTAIQQVHPVRRYAFITEREPGRLRNEDVVPISVVAIHLVVFFMDGAFVVELVDSVQVGINALDQLTKDRKQQA